jgi:hypothetical protein
MSRISKLKIHNYWVKLDQKFNCDINNFKIPDQFLNKVNSKIIKSEKDIEAIPKKRWLLLDLDKRTHKA